MPLSLMITHQSSRAQGRLQAPGILSLMASASPGHGRPPPQFWSPVLKIGLNNPWQEPHEVSGPGSDVTRNIEAGPGLY